MCSDKLSLLSYHGNPCVLIISADFINPDSIDYNLMPKIQCMFHKICISTHKASVCVGLLFVSTKFKKPENSFILQNIFKCTWKNI